MIAKEQSQSWKRLSKSFWYILYCITEALPGAGASIIAFTYVPPSSQTHHPSSLSVSVWMASTNRASPASKRSSRLALVYSGPAGSRPVRTDYSQDPRPSQLPETPRTHTVPSPAIPPVQLRACHWEVLRLAFQCTNDDPNFQFFPEIFANSKFYLKYHGL